MDIANTITEFTRLYLALFYTAVAVFYASRIITKQRVSDVKLVHAGDTFGSNRRNQMLFRYFRMAIWMVCVVRLFYPGLDQFLGFWNEQALWPVVILGNILLTAGFFFSMATHFSLGNEWRSGIDPNGPALLHTEGLYKLSRNPMYLGIAAAQLGFLLAMPSMFSALCLLVGWYSLRSQTFAEEAHLLKVFADDYLHYQRQVRRWL